MATHSSLQNAPLAELRETIRSGAYTGHTAGLAPGRLQVNLAILPEEYALDFARFCQRNPQPCPLVGVSDTGARVLHTLGQDLCADTDAPGYCVYEDGQLVGQRTDISKLWRDDFVAFALALTLLDEQITPTTITAFACILVGLLIAQDGSGQMARA